MLFEKNVGKEIFILIDESNNRCSATIYDTADIVLKAFANRLATNISDVTLYHGVLSKACSIPDDEISSNIDVIIFIPGSGNSCKTISCFSLEYLQKLIPAIVGNPPSKQDTDYVSIIDDTHKIPKQNIDNVYIFYGYSIELHYTFYKTDLDEEIISGSKKIYANISSTQTYSDVS